MVSSLCRWTALLTFCYCLQVNPVYGQSQEKMPLHNAYYLAKAIANFRVKQGMNPDTLRQILGGALWYGNSDTYQAKGLSELMTYTSTHYPILYQNLRQIADVAYDPLQIVLQNISTADLSIKLKKHPKTLDIIKSIKDTISSLEKNHDSALNKTYEHALQKEKEELAAVNEQFAKISIDLTTQADSNQNTSLSLQLQGIKKEKDSLQKRIDGNKEKIDEYTANSQKLKKYQDSLYVVNTRLTPEEVIALKGSEIPKASLNHILVSIPDKELVKNYNLTYTDNRSDHTTGVNPLSLQMPSQSQLIDAMAIYLAKRVKQEAVMWFFQTLQENIAVQDVVKKCFPNCYALLQSNEIYEVPKMGSAWRYAISKDFATMPEHIIKTEWFESRFGNKSWIKDAISYSWQMAQLIQQKYSYKDIITTLYTKLEPPITPSSAIGVGDVITLLHCINEEFYVQQNQKTRTLQLADLLRLTNEEFETMLGLIDLKYNSVFSRLLLKTSGAIHINDTKRLNTIRKWLGSLLLRVEQFEKMKGEFQAYISLVKENKDLPFNYADMNYWKFIKDLIRDINFSEIVRNDTSFFKTMDGNLSNLLHVIGEAQEVYQLLEQKNFAASVTKLVAIISPPSTDTIWLEKRFLDSLMTGKNLKFYQPKLVAAKPNDYDIEIHGNLVKICPDGLMAFFYKSHHQQGLNLLTKLAGFLNDVALAEKSKDLAKVIETYALPPGSYKRKRANWFSFDINAYVGIYAGYENAKAKGSKGDTLKTNGSVYGLTAPIGFAFSKSFGKKIKKNKFLKYSMDDLHPEHYKIGKKSKNFSKLSQHTMSLFFSVIDIGAVVSYRFDSDSESLPQEVKWAQVISPGVHLNWGIRGTPIVFVAGYQYTPQLRKLRGQTDNEQLNANRVFAGFSYDIPLFNLSSRSYNERRYKN